MRRPLLLRAEPLDLLAFAYLGSRWGWVDRWAKRRVSRWFS